MSKKIKFSLFFIAIFSLIFMLPVGIWALTSLNFSMGGEIDYTPQVFTVSWQNYDGSVLEEDEVTYTSKPIYNGTTPTRAATAQYTYTFSGWGKGNSSEIVDLNNESIIEDTNYTAQYTYQINSYTVTWVNYDSSVLEVDENVVYGTTPTYNGATPIKPTDGQYTFTFVGWYPSVSEVSGDITYTAVFTSALNEYTVIWKNYDGTILETDEGVQHGTTPTYNGATPTKPGNAQYSYTFKGWVPSVAEATGDVTYTAQFDEITNTYTITWQNWDGTVLETDNDVPYGTTPVYNASAPKRNSTAQYTYTFSGWNPTISAVTGNKTYKAQFSSTVNTYTVTWKNWDGTVLETDNDVPYGTAPTYEGATPTKAKTDQYTYTFSGWTPAVEGITGNTIYIAQFSSTVNQYTVSISVNNSQWGTVNKSSVNVDYGSSFARSGNNLIVGGQTITATPSSRTGVTNSLSGWTGISNAVTGNVSITANFASKVTATGDYLKDVNMPTGANSNSSTTGYSSATPFYFSANISFYAGTNNPHIAFDFDGTNGQNRFLIWGHTNDPSKMYYRAAVNNEYEYIGETQNYLNASSTVTKRIVIFNSGKHCYFFVDDVLQTVWTNFNQVSMNQISIFQGGDIYNLAISSRVDYTNIQSQNVNTYNYMKFRADVSIWENAEGLTSVRVYEAGVYKVAGEELTGVQNGSDFKKFNLGSNFNVASDNRKILEFTAKITNTKNNAHISININDNASTRFLIWNKNNDGKYYAKINDTAGDLGSHVASDGSTIKVAVFAYGDDAFLFVNEVMVAAYMNVGTISSISYGCESCTVEFRSVQVADYSANVLRALFSDVYYKGENKTLVDNYRNKSTGAYYM